MLNNVCECLLKTCFLFLSSMLSGGGETPEDGEEKDPQQGLSAGEQEKEEGVCGRPGAAGLHVHQAEQGASEEGG